MKLLVTGGCGFIGSHFIRLVLEIRPDWDIINLDALTYAGNLLTTMDVQTHPQYHFVYGSITNTELIHTLVQKVDAVVNFAAETHVDRSIDDAEPFIMTNILGVYRLSQACIKYEKRFHHVSTDEVFGSLGEHEPRFNELSSSKPRNPYSATKAAGDHLIKACIHTHGLRATISHCSNNYGIFLYPEKFLAIAITNLIENKPVIVHGDGKQIRDWIHVRDHAMGILAIIERGIPGEVYLMGGDSEMSIEATARAVLREMGMIDHMLTFVNDRPGQDLRYSIDYSKIERELGWKPLVTFQSGLAEMVQWYRKNESWWRPIKESAGYQSWYRTQVERNGVGNQYKLKANS